MQDQEAARLLGRGGTMDEAVKAVDTPVVPVPVVVPVNGGVRPGAGRKVEVEGAEDVTIRLPKSTIDAAEALAKARKTKRAYVLRAWVEIGRAPASPVPPPVPEGYSIVKTQELEGYKAIAGIALAIQPKKNEVNVDSVYLKSLENEVLSLRAESPRYKTKGADLLPHCPQCGREHGSNYMCETCGETRQKIDKKTD